MTEWSHHVDPDSGYTYYLNETTGETTWEKPEGYDDGEANSDLPEWSRVLDPSSGEYYYYNNLSGESSWTEPEGFDNKESEAAMKNALQRSVSIADLPHNLALLIAARKVQAVFRAKQGRKEMREKRAQKDAQDHGKSGWIKEHDATSGYDFWYNTETGESTWEDPEKKKEEEHEPEAVDLPRWVKVYTRPR